MQRETSRSVSGNREFKQETGGVEVRYDVFR